MDKFVIFSKPLVWVLLALVIAAYVGDAVINAFRLRFRDKAERLEAETPLGKEYFGVRVVLNRLELFQPILATVNMGVHLGEFVYLLFIKATPEEMLFLLMISVALALTVSRIKKEG